MYYPQMSQSQPERPTQDMATFLPVEDYISESSLSEEANYEDEDVQIE